jgi:hypothetical protein
MVKSVEGVYRNGKVELSEPAPVQGESRVIITFLANGPDIDMSARGIDSKQAADLKARLKAFEEDWRRPEMDAYDEL